MKRSLFIIAILIAGCIFSFAEEGMWLLTQIKDLELDKKGLKIEVEKIYSPDKPSLVHAVVKLGGGTAEFVSAQGLLLTNHHVAFNALQRVSSEENNYLQAGFLAATRAEEIQAPGYTALVFEKMEDVTEEVLKAAKGTDPLERSKKINAKIQKIKERTENGKGDILATVVSMYKGKQYILFVHRRFGDVRLVYVPPMSIGNYGGDVDNWIWPRHTGDFSFLRVYMAPDGSGCTYSKDNVPYRPKKWLKISTGNSNEGDFNFIIGYPGFTTRYRTSNSVAYNLNYHYPESIKNYKEVIEILQGLAKNDPKAAIKKAGLDKSLNNTMKNYQGKIDGMTRTDFLSRKKEFEKQLRSFIEKDEKLKRQYGDLFARIEKKYRGVLANREHNDAINAFRLAGTLFSIANQICYVASQRAKPKSEREPSFSEREVEKNLPNLKYAYYSYYEPADKALLKRVLRKAENLPKNSRIEGLEKIDDIDAFVENVYRKTGLADVDYARSLYKKTPEEIEKLDDPLIVLARKLSPVQEKYRKKYQKFAADIINLRKQYMDAIYAWKGKGVYPDANGTVRFTYGNIAGYSPRDAIWYHPFTTLSGVIAKNTGRDPFAVPEKLKILYAKRDFGNWVDPELGDVPVAFTNRCDITGGNSGSPVLNARGELIGIAFDGNYEAMISDWQYHYQLQRTISVDIRYVLFITEKLAGAGYLLKEMGLK